MARVIELRAWNKYHKKMHSVYEINFDHSIAKTRDDETGGTYTFGFIDLELMQFTGLRDKKGVKIFEGDILIDPLIKPEHYENGNYSYGVVDFFNGVFRIGYGHIDKTLYDEIGAAYKQVIVGNIHQNPKLLEKNNA